MRTGLVHASKKKTTAQGRNVSKERTKFHGHQAKERYIASPRIRLEKNITKTNNLASLSKAPL